MTKVRYQSEVLIPEAFILTDVSMPHRNPEKLYKVEFRKKLDESRNYKEGNDFNVEAIKVGDPWRPSLSDYFVILKEGQRKNDFLNFNYETLRKNIWTNFSTGIEYNSEGKRDRIINYEGTKFENIFEGNYVGQGGWLKNLKNELIFKDLTGLDRKGLEKISFKVNKTPGYLSRANSNLGVLDKKQAGLGACSDRLYFYAYWDLGLRSPCFRVIIKEQN